jgi:hypothetical protein
MTRENRCNFPKSTVVRPCGVHLRDRIAKHDRCRSKRRSRAATPTWVDRLGSCVFSMRCGPTDQWCTRSDTVINHKMAIWLERPVWSPWIYFSWQHLACPAYLRATRLVAELVIAAASVIHSSLACAHGPTSRQCGNNFWVIVVIDDIFNLASLLCANFVKQCRIPWVLVYTGWYLTHCNENNKSDCTDVCRCM